ncbi:hypothetical protein ACO0LM_21480 [Undibacterium sp. Di26W]|uniref:hypothetical protein n=1 Tax=Undibacterium sp. Di26W TaxID=3413035 RepID=UPI003BF28D88
MRPDLLILPSAVAARCRWSFIPYFGMVLYVLARTDLILTTSRSFAVQCAKD